MPSCESESRTNPVIWVIDACCPAATSATADRTNKHTICRIAAFTRVQNYCFFGGLRPITEQKVTGFGIDSVFSTIFAFVFSFIDTDVEDQETISIHVVQVPAKVPDDLLHLSVYRDDAVPVALHR